MDIDYKALRLGLGLSRADVSALAKRAGYQLSLSSLNRLEHKGSGTIGSRGLPHAIIGWLRYIYGLDEADFDWMDVERGAPVVVHGEKGAFSFIAVEDDGSIATFGGARNTEKFRSFPTKAVRLVAPTALPDPCSADLFDPHPRGSQSTYAARILSHIRSHPGAHSVGALAYTLKMNNGVVSRITAHLAGEGEIVKVGRGVYVLPEEPAPPEAAKAALAERVGVVERRLDF
jgi:hypothetical protein